MLSAANNPPPLFCPSPSFSLAINSTCINLKSKLNKAPPLRHCLIKLFTWTRFAFLPSCLSFPHQGTAGHRGPEPRLSPLHEEGTWTAFHRVWGGYSPIWTEYSVIPFMGRSAPSPMGKPGLILGVGRVGRGGQVLTNKSLSANSPLSLPHLAGASCTLSAISWASLAWACRGFRKAGHSKKEEEEQHSNVGSLSS